MEIAIAPEKTNSLVFPRKNEYMSTQPIMLNNNQKKHTEYVMNVDPMCISSSPSNDLFILNLKKRMNNYYVSSK